MASSASYDQALLDEAPEVTAAQKQRFYDPELLYDKPARSSKDKLDGVPAAAGTTAHTDIEAGHTNGAHKEYSPNGRTASPTPAKKIPFYKTRRGIIIIVVALVVIIGAAVGGGVGGALGGKKSDDNSNVSQSSGASAPVDTSTAAPSGSGGAGIGTGGETTIPDGGLGTGGGTSGGTPSPTSSQGAPIGSDTPPSPPDTSSDGGGANIVEAASPMIGISPGKV